ncbi:hypothetical protein MalM25_25300 [Planctomycetes bacterium MalM25]|nr:hypothetical protein MalM25_25300 [Planctomycetes bacterium MalM25]
MIPIKPLFLSSIAGTTLLLATVGTASENSVVIEAEDFATSTSWTTVVDSSASGGVYATVAVNTLSDRTLTPASYNVETPAAGTYYLYARAYAPTYEPRRNLFMPDQNDSFFIFDGFNGAPDLSLPANDERVNEFFPDDVMGADQWGWLNASAGISVEKGATIDSPEYKYVSAAPGVETLNIAGREDDTRIDVFVLSLDASLTASELNALVGLVPEPSSAALLLTSVLGMFRRKR